MLSKNEIKTFKRAVCSILIFFVFNSVLHGQDYQLKLQFKEIHLSQNIRSIRPNDSVFIKSRFNDKYYVVLQFREMPTNAEKDKLKSYGIELLDYIPNLAFTARLNSLTTLGKFKKNKILK